MSDTEIVTDPIEAPRPVGAAERTDGIDAKPAYLIGALSAGAAVIHLMMAPVHAPASQLEAVGFALAGWFQIVMAMLLVFRPSRRWLSLAGIGNAVILAAWVWSRTKGLPFGEEPWTPEAVGGVDLTCAVFEGGVVIGALAQLMPRPTYRVSPVLSAIGAMAVVAVTTVVLVNPKTAAHDHGHGVEVEAGGATAAGAQTVAAPARCDESLNPVAYWNEAKIAGTDGTTATPAAAGPMAGMDHSAEHAHDAAPTTVPAASGTPTTLGPLKGRGSAHYDRLIELANKPGEAAAGFLIAELGTASQAEYDEFIASLNPANAKSGHDAMAGTGNTSEATRHTMSHMGPQQWRPMSDPADCEAVRQELAKSKAVADKYPTAQDAMDAGYKRVAPYVPGIASHWMKFSLVDGTFDVNEPEMLLYDGNGADSHIAGISYYVMFESDAPPSQGFTGDNDLYHRHLGLCSGPKGVIGDSSTTDEECAAAGGRKNDGGDGWMSHAWVVPGCESPWGVFSGINPLLDQQLGQQSGKNDGGCAGSAAKKRYDLSAGSAATMPTTTVPAGNETAAGR